MPSAAKTSAPLPVLRLSSSLVLYCSSSTPEPLKVTLAVTPLAFCAATKPGMTESVIQAASAAFLPPATSLALITRVTSLALALALGLALVPESLAPTQPVRRRDTAVPLVSSTARRERRIEVTSGGWCRCRPPHGPGGDLHRRQVRVDLHQHPS